jgi:hypothetical protein
MVMSCRSKRTTAAATGSIDYLLVALVCQCSGHLTARPRPKRMNKLISTTTTTHYYHKSNWTAAVDRDLGKWHLYGHQPFNSKLSGLAALRALVGTNREPTRKKAGSRRETIWNRPGQAGPVPCLFQMGSRLLTIWFSVGSAKDPEGPNNVHLMGRWPVSRRLPARSAPMTMRPQGLTRSTSRARHRGGPLPLGLASRSSHGKLPGKTAESVHRTASSNFASNPQELESEMTYDGHGQQQTI